MHRIAALTAVLLAALLALSGGAAMAASFTPGDVVVYRVGDGSGTLANTGNPVFLDEYTPSGTLVQSIPMPTSASGARRPLVASGTAASEGQLNRSTDGQYLLLTGYGVTPPAASSLASSSSAAVPRVVGRVAYDGSVDTTTALTDLADANNPRAAASTNGIDLWVTGAAGGVRYAPLGTSGSSTAVSGGTIVNFTDVAVAGGQLYGSSTKGTGVPRVLAIGSGTPVTSGQAVTGLNGFSATNNYASIAPLDLDPSAPGVDTIYAVDQSGTPAIHKFALVGSTWTDKGTITPSAATFNGKTPVTSGLAAVEATVSGGTVSLYATTNGSSATTGTLFATTDAAVSNQAPTNAQATGIANAPSGQTFRGVAAAPVQGSGITYGTATGTGGTTTPSGGTGDATAAVFALQNPLTAATVSNNGVTRTVPEGGLSGMQFADATHLWTLSDRGPNGNPKVSGSKVRTFLNPCFTPTIYQMALGSNGAMTVEQRIRLHLPAGATDPVQASSTCPGAPDTSRITGLPQFADASVASANGVSAGADELAYGPDGVTRLPVDPYGLDPEGIARDPRDDSFWISEEYRPSLLHVSADGTLLERIVPAGETIPGSSAVPTVAVLPRAYQYRQPNRGFEGVAISPDGTRLYAMMQSPISPPGNTPSDGRVLRLIVLDVRNASAPSALHEYWYQTDVAPSQNDEVVSDIFAIDATHLYVDERDKGAGPGSHKRIYQIDLSGATDLLGNPAAATLEANNGAGTTPVAKSLYLNFDYDFTHYPWEKAEGIAPLPGGGFGVVNDNDFAFDQADNPAAKDAYGVTTTGAASELRIFKADRAPVCQDASGDTTVAVALDVPLACSDPDVDTVTLTTVSGPQHGTASISGTSARYVPAAGFAGTDTFTYVGTDLAGTSSAPRTVTVRVVDQAPSCADAAASTAQRQAVAIPLSCTDADGETLSLRVASPPDHGTVSISGSSATYTPDAAFFGRDTFTFTAIDPEGESSAVRTVTVDVAPLPATISGTVRGPLGALAGATVTVYDATTRGAVATLTTTFDGTYATEALAAGSYVVKFTAPSYVREYWQDAPTFAAATAVVTSAGAPATGVDAELVPGGAIAGRVATAGGPLAGTDVSLYDAQTRAFVAGTKTAADGTYALDFLPAGRYVLRFAKGGYATVYWDGAATFGNATPVEVAAGGRFAGLDATLTSAGQVAGTVAESPGGPLSGATVSVLGDDASVVATATTDDAGRYRVGALPAGAYTIRFSAQGHVTQYWRRAASRGAALPVTVRSGRTTNGIRATLRRQGGVRGIVRADGRALAGATVTLLDGDGADAGSAVTADDGTYGITADPRAYVVRFSADGRAPRYWRRSATAASAARLAVRPGATRTGIDADLAPAGA